MKMSCREAAMNLLARREHSRLELKLKLQKRDFSDDEIKTCLDKLEADGLLDEARFVEAFTRLRVRRGSGSIKIRHELKARGIMDEMIETALLDYQSQWLGLAQREQVKRFGSLPADFKERARQARFLQNRGFDFEIIREVLAL
jgi:regulatory protein